MTQTLAVEWARHKIRVNAIGPRTGRHPRRLGATSSPTPNVMEASARPFRCAASPTSRKSRTPRYLLSDYASYVTGEAFVIDGGQWLSGRILGQDQADDAQ